MKKCFKLSLVAAFPFLICACLADKELELPESGPFIQYKPGVNASGRYPLEILEAGSFFILPNGNGFEHKNGWLFSYWQGQDNRKYQGGQAFTVTNDMRLILTAVWFPKKDSIPEQLHGVWHDADDTRKTWEFGQEQAKIPFEPLEGNVLAAYTIGPVIYCSFDGSVFCLGLYEIEDNKLKIQFNYYGFLGRFEDNVPPQTVTLVR